MLKYMVITDKGYKSEKLILKRETTGRYYVLDERGIYKYIVKARINKIHKTTGGYCCIYDEFLTDEQVRGILSSMFNEKDN